MGALQNYLLGFGALGLFAIALLDSALVFVPGGADAVLVLMSALRPDRTPLYVGSAAVGSTLGSLILYGIARRGGEMMLSKFAQRKRERAHALMSKYDLPAMFLAVLLPPPFPTKLFVLTAGALAMNALRFSAGVFAGRLLRFSLEGFLVVRYGHVAGEIMMRHSWKLAVLALLLVGVLILVIRLKRKPAVL